MFPPAWEGEKKVMAQGEIVTVRMKVHELKKGQSRRYMEGVGVVRVAALSGSSDLECCYKRFESVPIIGPTASWHRASHTPNLKRPSRPPADLGYAANKWECGFIGQSQLQRLFFEKKLSENRLFVFPSHEPPTVPTHTH